MKDESPVAVCSRSFSRHPLLRARLSDRYRHVTFNDQGRSLKGSELVSFLRGHARAIVALERIDDQLLEALPELKVISKYGVGMDLIDLGALEKRGVRLGWAPGVNKRSVAELVLAFALALLHRVPSANQTARSGGWKSEIGRDLTGATVGLIGFGQIGREVAALLAPFKVTLLVHDVALPVEVESEFKARSTGIEELLAQADVISIHLPLTEATRNVLNAQRLALLKPGAVLINTARGGLVDEQALEKLLREGRIAGAAFDVFATEPPENLELLQLPNFLATPHIASSTEQGILAMGNAAIEGLESAQRPSALGLV